MRVRLLAASVLLLPSLFVVAPARADDAADKAMAEALFKAGKELMADNKLSEACPKFAESHRLDPKPGTILNLATCHEQEGRLATAWADYQEAYAFAARRNQVEREKFARQKAAELEKKVSYVKFNFPKGTENVELLVDGKALTNAVAGTRFPIDPGDHALEARAPQKKTWTFKLVIPASPPGEKTIEVPALEDDKTAVAAPPPAKTAWADTDDASGSTQRTVGWIVAGAGVVGLGVGGFFGIKTLSEKSTVDDNCQGAFCNDEGLAANDRAHSAATISTIGIIAGGVLIAGGLALVFTAPSGPPAKRGAIRPLSVVW
jgi:hypothetical protein